MYIIKSNKYTLTALCFPFSIKNKEKRKIKLAEQFIFLIKVCHT